VRLMTLHRRNLAHHWRGNVAVLLGVITGSAALTGALLMGDSMRGSLRTTALDRLGNVSHAVRGTQFFRESLCDEIAAVPDVEGGLGPICPAIMIRGSASHADSHATVHQIGVLGVDDRFWRLAEPGTHATTSGTGRTVILTEPLAEELRAKPGDDVLLRMRRPASISPETLLGRRDETGLAVRLTIRDVIPAESLAAFSFDARQTQPRNALVPLGTLQRTLGQRERVNTLLVGGNTGAPQDPGQSERRLADALRQCLRLDDIGLHLRTSPSHGYIALESNTFLVPPMVEQAASAAAETIGARTSAVLSYLANTIGTSAGSGPSVPYSAIAAIEPTPELCAVLRTTAGHACPLLEAGDIVLNEWTYDQLGAHAGDDVQLTYYVTGPFGRLEEQQATFRLRDIVRLAGGAADAGFTPAYPGVTDSDDIGEWNPPFPIDLRRIRDEDEAYWDEYRATPKAFVSLGDGQRLWASGHARLGQVTSLRVYVSEGGESGPDPFAEMQTRFEQALLARLEPGSVGVRIDAVRARALEASEGATDFAGLFVGFSFFLIVSAALLVALLHRLSVERRGREIGLLLAAGYPRRTILRLLMSEGALIALVGAGVGLWAARGYAWLMLAGLQSWWSDAVSAPFLELHGESTSYIAGYAGSVAVGLVSIYWSVRGITRLTPRALLAGSTGPAPGGARSAKTPSGGRGMKAVTLAALGVGSLLVLTSLATDRMPKTTAFFGGGTALLIGFLAGLACWLRTEPVTALRPTGRHIVVRLGLRNARRHAGRSLLTAGLVASATFTITGLQAMRRAPTTTEPGRETGRGGFTLLAEADVPIAVDLNTPSGRSTIGVSSAADALLAGTTFVPFRLQPGDETSCLNLYRPTQPRLLGASAAMIARGGFRFAAAEAEFESERNNAWTLLEKSLPGDVVPAIADEAAARWQLHLQLGDELTVSNEGGRDVRLRLVALLQGSALQGEVIIAESNFTELFPSATGHSFYLIDAPAERAAEVERTLEHELATFGFAVVPTSRRLAELYAVQNTYLSTFQTLGGVGLLLGTIGLAAVLLRNVWERRGELALLRTLGFSRVAVGTLVIAENAFLVAAGLVIGVSAAAVVIAPHVVQRSAPVPWGSLLLLFTAVFLAGLAAGVVALAPALRAPLLPALRSE